MSHDPSKTWVTANFSKYLSKRQVLLVIPKCAMTHYELPWPTMSHYEPLWATMTHYELLWATMSHYELLWPTMSHYDPLWPTMSHYEPLWPTMRHYELLLSANIFHPTTECKTEKRWYFTKYWLFFFGVNVFRRRVSMFDKMRLF